eukprot:TRINITY_DN7070_c1_g1_i1.p1 TRINITY_DN7070_c1_g1~~TRINITY_DN7070_c1_g1_i1.p1  ORF type:complete len:159 (+),score=25.71 TRINITY_DN7070_c1_g1_i1:12-488(+)
MIKLQDFDRTIGVNHCKAIQCTRLSKMKTPIQFIDHLNEIISPTVALIRSRSGIIQPFEKLTFRRAGRLSRLSHQRSSVDLIFFHREIGQIEGPFPEKVSSFRETEAFEHFFADLEVMLQQRGLALLDVPAAALQKDQNLRLCFSDSNICSNLNSTKG